jgi:hypothetical protein
VLRLADGTRRNGTLLYEGMLEDHIYPTDFFPFATTAARDPVTGAEGSILDRARALGAIPKLFYVNNSSEYWNRAASLIATDPRWSARP